nr:alpha/beta hydrolase [Acholeplasmatales bacterium]
MKKLIRRSAIFSFIALIFSVALVCSKTYASESVKQYEMTDTDLYDKTNTYKFSYDTENIEITQDIYGSSESISDFFDNLGKSITMEDCEPRYDLSNKNSKTINAIPQLTVFTHGWEGHASSWDNKFDGHAYDSDSAVQKLYDKFSFSDVFVAKFINSKNFKFINVTNNYKNNTTVNLDYAVKNSAVSNNFDAIKNDKHTIIIFESDRSGLGHDYIYNQFNYMLSAAVLQVKNLNGGLLPKINLVGHSRGGITNMQYALDHPDLVSTMYSYDTPYMGTSVGSLATNSYELRNLFNFLDSEERYLSSYTGFTFFVGARDLTNTTIINKLVNRWNNGYDKFYRNIGVYAFSSTTSLKFFDVEFLTNFVANFIDNLPIINTLRGFLSDLFDENMTNDIIELTNRSIADIIVRGAGRIAYDCLKIISSFINFSIEVNNVFNNIKNFVESYFNNLGELYSNMFRSWDDFWKANPFYALYKTIGDFNNYKSEMDSLIMNIFELVSEEMRFKRTSQGDIIIKWDSDVIVDLDSQKGIGERKSYRGFKTNYTRDYLYTYDTFSVSHIKVLHDTSLHNVILDNIMIGDSKNIHTIDLSNCQNYS